jgi:hypothetical protein
MRTVAVILMLAGAVLGADVADMSGNWRLNPERSKWNGKPAPKSVRIYIDHKEPALKYEGKVSSNTLAGEAQESTFRFDGAIDGKEYTVQNDNGTQRITIQRVNKYTTRSTFHSPDGKTEEVTTTTMSPDGKTMTRRVGAKGPDGSKNWVEVYEREQ